MSDKAPGERILLVDDQRTIVDAAVIGLTRTGYQVQGTTVPQDAISLALQEPFDLLLCDLVLPGLSGIEVLRTVKQLYPDIAAVMITGYGSMQSAIEALDAGADAFLLKPFTTAQLRRTVADVLTKRRTLRESLRAKALMPLYDSSKAFHGEMSLERVSSVVVEQVARSVGAGHVTLLLSDSEAGHDFSFHVHATFPPGATAPAIEEAPLGWVVRTGEVLTSSELSQQGPRGGAPTADTLYAPLQASGSVVGVLLVQKATGSREFSDADAEIVAIQAGQAAVAIKNALLLKEREESYLEAMGALANALNARDPGTFGHTERVSKNAVLIAKAMGLREEEVEQVRVGAVLHDIGYVGLPDTILLKPGSLTVDEYVWIKQHPIIGDRILAPVAALQKARPVVLNHHERYDGAGYPHGIAGDDIPLAARVVTVADAFDAVTEMRVYRPGGSVVEALEELRRHTGSQFDPIAVDAFFDVLTQAGRPHQVQRAES